MKDRGFIIVLLLSGLLHTNGYAQTPAFELNAKEQTLLNCLKEVEKKYGIKSSYDPVFIANYKLNQKIRGSDEQSFMENLLLSFPIKVRKLKNVYLLSPDPYKKIPERKITGRVVDPSGSPLGFAYLIAGKSAVTSNEDGYFSMKIDHDTASLQATYIGYRTADLRITPDSDELIIQLTPAAEHLAELVVNSSQDPRVTTDNGTFSLDPQQISSLPAIGGQDILKSLQLLPGIQATNEASEGLTISGSSPNHNLIILDGIRVYTASHFLGLFTVFNPHIISKIDIQKNGFEPKYGGTIGGIIDVKTSRRLIEKSGFRIGVNTIGANAFGATRLGKRKRFSLAGSYRRSFQGIIRNRALLRFLDNNRIDNLDSNKPSTLKEALELTPTSQFGDAYLNANFRLSKTSSLHAIYYGSWNNYRATFNFAQKPVVRDNDFAVADILGVSWQKHWSTSHSSKLTLSYSGQYSNTSLYGSSSLNEEAAELFNHSFNTFNSIKTNSLNWAHEQDLGKKGTLSYGLDISAHDDSFSIFQNKLPGKTAPYNFGLSNNKWTYTFYASHKFQVTNWEFHYGLRPTYYSKTRDFFGQPRINTQYHLNNSTSLYLGWSKHRQFVNRLTLSPYGNSDQTYWALADGQEFEIMGSRHLVGGVKYEDDNWTINADIYHRRNTNIQEIDYSFYLDNIHLQDSTSGNIITANGHSYGADLLLQRNFKRYHTWVSYSFNRTFYRSPRINYSEFYPSNFDQRHEVNWVNSYQLGKWKFSLVFLYGSGKPYTPIGEVTTQKQVLFNLNKVNSRRLPAYHRLDMSARYKTSYKKLKIETGLSIFNLYNRKNIRSRRYGIDYTFDTFGAIQEVKPFAINVNLLGFIPTAFLNIGI